MFVWLARNVKLAFATYYRASESAGRCQEEAMAEEWFCERSRPPAYVSPLPGWKKWKGVLVSENALHLRWR